MAGGEAAFEEARSMGSRRVLALVLGMLVVPAFSSANDFTPQAYSARTGISFGPDQFHTGVHLQLGAGSKPQIRPALDLGLGNGVRLLSVAADVLYHFDGAQWRPYVGGGPGLNFIDVTDGVGEADGVAAKLVAHAVTGISWTPRRKGRGYFLEGRFGVGHTPDLRLALGMSF
jgi:hypothetical protein